MSKHGRFPECYFIFFHYNTVSLILPIGILKFYLSFEKGCMYFLILSILKILGHITIRVSCIKILQIIGKLRATFHCCLSLGSRSFLWYSATGQEATGKN